MGAMSSNLNGVFLKRAI